MNNNTSEIYGYPLLDNIHNLFPEILYDNVLFPHNDNDSVGRILGWARFRIRHLFPQTFQNARANYNHHTVTERREEFDEWLFLRNNNLLVPRSVNQNIVRNFPEFSPIQTEMNRIWAPPSNSVNQDTSNLGTGNQNAYLPEILGRNSTGLSGFFSSLVPPVQRQMGQENQRTRILGEGTINQIIQNTIFDEIVGLVIPPRTALFRFFDPVPINPTLSEIERGSEILTSDSIPMETVCIVCQDHNSPRDISNNSNGWRKILNCQHLFHKDCIDRWFESHVGCPICRGDIRVPVAAAAAARIHTDSNQTLPQNVAERTPSHLD